MQVGFIGAGAVGSAIATHVTQAGHEVAVSNARGPESLSELAEELGERARATSVPEAAAFGDVVFEAIPFGEYETLPVDELANTTVVSASNHDPDRDGEFTVDASTHTEAIAEHLQDARVMKAFNAMSADTIREGARPDAPLDERLAVYVVGDDALAKATVVNLVEDIGFAPVDLGRLSNGRLLQPGARLYDNPLTLTDAQSLLENLTH
jgi:hypothetical protein